MSKPFGRRAAASRGVGPVDLEAAIGFVRGGLLVLIALSFFLPYLPGTRLRIDVVVGYMSILVVPFVSGFKERTVQKIFLLSLAAAVWSGARIGLSGLEKEDAFFAIQLVTALNFPFFAACLFLAFRTHLLRYKEQMLVTVLCLSVGINILAVFQWLDVDHPVNSFVFDNYGGALPASVEELPQDVVGGITTNAEFLAKIAGRYSSIFGGMYVLAAFDVMVIALSMAALSWTSSAINTRRIAAAAIGSALLGGVLSASKTFYLGTAIAVAALVVLRVVDPKRVLIMGLVAIPAYFLVSTEGADDSTVGSVFDLIWSSDMEAILGSRYSADGLLTTIETILSSPSILLYGVGKDIGELYLADNGYLMPIIVGGVPLAAMTYLAIALLVRENYRQFKRGNTIAAGFIATHISFLVAAIGIPTYQLPRVTLLFLFLNLLFLSFAHNREASPNRNGATREIHASS
jgi:hypothetical protein